METFLNQEHQDAWLSFKKTGSVYDAIILVECFKQQRLSQLNNEVELGM